MHRAEDLLLDCPKGADNKLGSEGKETRIVEENYREIQGDKQGTKNLLGELTKRIRSIKSWLKT